MDMMVGYSLEVTESGRHVREKRRKNFSIGDREQVQNLFHLIRVLVWECRGRIMRFRVHTELTESGRGVRETKKSPLVISSKCKVFHLQDLVQIVTGY